MAKSIACNAPYGNGGLGQHLAEVVEETRTQGKLQYYYTSVPVANDPHGKAINPLVASWLKYTPVRYSPGWLSHLGGDLFDRAVAASLTHCEEFEGFGGQALYCFRRARQLGCEVLSLQAANSHVNNVNEQHRKAIQQFGIETSWLNEAQRQKTLLEYEMADVIHVASEYAYQSFLAAGVPSHKLCKRTLKVQPRFVPSQKQPEDGIFRVVYTGALTVTKGIPVLIEAFSHLPDQTAELILVGGWTTRSMRRYLQSCLARDSRIRIVPGDPLPHLQRANVYVHPSYQDGFAYAPMEALASGVPVIVTEDTGMKEYVQEGVNGYVIPTGDWAAILERIQVCRITQFAISNLRC